jgi:hypothetical protein
MYNFLPTHDAETLTEGPRQFYELTGIHEPHQLHPSLLERQLVREKENHAGGSSHQTLVNQEPPSGEQPGHYQPETWNFNTLWARLGAHSDQQGKRSGLANDFNTPKSMFVIN